MKREFEELAKQAKAIRSHRGHWVYPAEFRKRAVKLLERHGRKKVIYELGVPSPTLSNWVKVLRRKDGNINKPTQFIEVLPQSKPYVANPQNDKYRLELTDPHGARLSMSWDREICSSFGVIAGALLKGGQ